MTIINRKSGKLIYFLFPPAAARVPVTYPHQAVALAEGLRALGWRVTANVPAWRESVAGESLFEVVSDAPAVVAGQAPAIQADVVVVDSGWQADGDRSLPDWVVARGRRFVTVGIDGDDLSAKPAWYRRPRERALDRVLRAHGQRAFAYPAAVRPWAFGLSERVMGAIDDAPAAGPRRGLGWNFNHKVYAHSVRTGLERDWLPKIEPRLSEHIRVDRTIDPPPAEPDAYEQLMHRQTCGRHIRSYYGRLRRLAAVACFGGWYLPAVRQPESGLAFRLGRAWYRKFSWSSRVVGQWDSWRFWETLYAGAAALQLDFEAFGFRLPVMPVANQHYIAVRPGENDEEVIAILNNRDRLAAIGEAGRAWVTEHYSPLAVAQRWLSIVNLPSHSITPRGERQAC